MATNILGIDLGTTAVKVYLYPIGYHASVPTNAYISMTNNSASSNHETTETSTCRSQLYYEQDITKILQAIDTALEEVIKQSGKSSEAVLGLIKSIGICDQMHGIVMWSSTERFESTSTTSPSTLPLTYSNLITWEDKRCSTDFLTTINQEISNYISNNRNTDTTINNLTPLFSGFGISTLLWYLHYQPTIIQQYQYTGTIGTFLSCYLTNTLNKPVMDPTDSASWGCYNIKKQTWEIALLNKLNSNINQYLPRIVSSRTCIGLSNIFNVSLTPTLAKLKDIPVYGSIGDHPASMIMALSSIEKQSTKETPLPNTSSSTIAVITLGTSAQIALASSLYNSSSISISDNENTIIALPAGCELRPFVNLSNPSDKDNVSSSSVMLVGASMNGGNILSNTISLMENRVKEEYIKQSNSTTETLSYNWNRNLVYEILEKAAIQVSFDKIQHISIILPYTERTPVGWHTSNTSLSSLTNVTETDLSTSTASSTSSCCYTLDNLCASTDYSSGEIYAIAAYNVIKNIIARLPLHFSQLYHTTKILAVGGGFAKSLVLRTYLQLYIHQLHHNTTNNIEIVFMNQDSEYAGAIGIGIYLQSM